MNLAHCSEKRLCSETIDNQLIHHLSTQNLEFGNLLNDQIQWVVAEEIFQNL